MINEALLEIARKYTINGYENGEQGKLPSLIDVMYLARAVMDNEAREVDRVREVEAAERSLRSRVDNLAGAALAGLLANAGGNLPTTMVVRQAYDYADEMVRLSKERHEADLKQEEQRRGR